MTRAEQKKLFMAFYDTSAETREWAKKKWSSGTQSLAPESLAYMEYEVQRRRRNAEEAAAVVALIEKEKQQDGAEQRPTTSNK